LVIQVIVAGFYFAGQRDLPALPFHQGFDARDGIFETVVPVEMSRVLHQMGITAIPPGIAILDPGNVPGGMVDGSGNGLNNLNGFGHKCHLLSAVRFSNGIRETGVGAIILIC
jgi:hypothetical protein